MISRVTQQTTTQQALRNLQSNMSDLSRLQDRASSLKAISRPSDDPSATAASLSIRTAQRASEQYARNAADGEGWLSTVESAMSRTTELLNRVRDLTVQGANDGALSPAAKETIAVELESLKAELVATANTAYLGRHVFAGNSDAATAFVPDPAWTGPADRAPLVHTGAVGSTVLRQVGADSTVRVDADGAAVFGSGDDSVFTLIDSIARDLRSGENVGQRLGAIDERMALVHGLRSEAGTRAARLERAGEANVENSDALERQRAGVEDLDLAEVVLDLKLQEMNYQASLAVTARVLQPTLMDFLR